MMLRTMVKNKMGSSLVRSLMLPDDMMLTSKHVAK